MSNLDDLNIARKKLEAALGDNVKQYFLLLKHWFHLKTTKEEFDIESRKLLAYEQIHLHNDFLLHLFNKCQSLATLSSHSSSVKSSVSRSTSSSLKDKTNRRNKVKRRSRSDKANFEPADFVDYIVPPQALPHAQDEPLRYSAQELFLPDMSLILGRMLVRAWEVGLDGAEEAAAELLVLAVQYFLKNILMAVFARRKGYKIRDGNFIYALGSSIPNPWLRNTVISVNEDKNRFVEDESNKEEALLKPPIHNLTLDEVEQKAAYEMACGDIGRTVTYPVTAYQLLETLQVERHVIPSHTVYSINMARIITMLNHPTHEEMETMTT